MQEVFLGEFIRQKRIERGLTQEKLCDGICEPMTLSRLENGRQTPSRNVMNALLQRLGISHDRYFALLSKNEIQIAALQKDINACYLQKNYALGLEKLKELENIAEPEDNVTRQFILSFKALLGKTEQEPYSLEEQLAMQLEALSITSTSPQLDMDEINKGLYTFEEIKIFTRIANLYSDLGQHKKATDIYDQLLKYIKKHFKDVLEMNGMLPMVAYNYARELRLRGHYNDAIESAEEGRQMCIEYGHYQFLPGFAAIMGECCHFLGQEEKSKEHFYSAYYLYKAMEDTKNTALMQKNVREYFNIEFEF